MPGTSTGVTLLSNYCYNSKRARQGLMSYAVSSKWHALLFLNPFTGAFSPVFHSILPIAEMIYWCLVDPGVRHTSHTSICYIESSLDAGVISSRNNLASST